jgi:hypothetical protein
MPEWHTAVAVRCLGGGYALDEIILFFLRFGANSEGV